MPRRFGLALTVLAIAALSIAALAGAAAVAFGRTRDSIRLPDGRTLYMHCVGHGSPAVLLEGGYLGTSGAWSAVQGRVSGLTRVCAYDRAGYGRSDPGPEPRDGKAVAQDLDAALRAARIKGPYVLVGHSAGGLYVRLFADLRPSEVAGMVLVDPSVEHQDRRFAAVFGPGAGSLEPRRIHAERCLEAAERKALPSADPQLAGCTPKPRPGRSSALQATMTAEAVRPGRWRTAVSELDTLWAGTSDEIDQGRRSYGDIPLIVLTAGGTYADAPGADGLAATQLWRTLHKEVAARSSRGEERLVEGASHNMMADRPDVVAGAIEEVVRAARAPQGGIAPHR